jgi:hypothetical protein
MQNLDIYSFIMDFKGGTYCSQVHANSMKSALNEWCKVIKEQQGEIKFLTNNLIKEIQEQLADIDNAPVLLKGLTNFWCTYLLTPGGSISIHIVLTK